MRYKLIFDEVMIRQLRRLGTNRGVRDVLSKMLDKIEELGPRAGKLLDVGLGIFEVKVKRPSIRLYYRCLRGSDEIYVFEYEVKRSSRRQQGVIDRIRRMLKS